MKFDLPDDMMREVVSEALMRSLDEQKRAALIKDAIAYVLTPETRAGYTGVSPLQSAFRQGVADMARKAIAEMLQGDTAIRTEIDKMIAEAAARVVGPERSKVVDRLAETIERAIAGDRY